MSEFRIFFRPNWLPSLNPGLYDLTDRLMAESVPQIKQAVQRRETPNILVYGDFMLTFENYDRRLDDLFNLDLIQGTDLANLRAPLLHYGFMYVADREFGQVNFRNAIGFVDPRSVRIDNVNGVIGVTVYSPAKLLEKGNAERVHRFSNISAPAPYLLLGYDLTTPANRPAHAGTGTAYIANLSQTLNGNFTLFTQELVPGNTITIGANSATIEGVTSDGAAQITAPWGGPTIAFPGAAYNITGQDGKAFLLRNTTAIPLASTLPILPDDKFVAVERVLPAAFTEAMDVNAISQDDLVVESVLPQGNDLIILVTVRPSGLTLLVGTATLQHLNPWYHYRRADELLSLLVAETNSALAAAGYPDALQLVQDIYSGLLGNSALDLIDDFNLPLTFTPPVPSTGIAWAANGAARALLHGGGYSGYNKPDFLQDPAVTDRPFSNSLFLAIPPVTVGPGAIGGGSTAYFIPGPFPYKFPNPAPALAGLIPPPDKAQMPSIFQEIHYVGPGFVQMVGVGAGGGGKIESLMSVIPSSYGLGATKYAYVLDTYDIVSGTSIPSGSPGFPDFALATRQGFKLSLLQTTDLGVTWGTKPLTTQYIDIDAQLYSEADFNDGFPVFDPFAQGSFHQFPVAGGFLYIITDGGRQKPMWRFNASDVEDPATLGPALVQFQDGTDYATNAGNRSGAVFDGSNVFYFEDQAASKTDYPQIASMGAGSNTITGAGFLKNIKPGDKIFFAYHAPLLPDTFTVASVNSDVNITTVETNTGAGISQYFQIIKPLGQVRLWYWNGATMKLGTLVGFPNLAKADFSHAFIDKSRNRLYIVNGGVLYRITLSWNAGTGTLTAVQVFSTVIDQPSYNANEDNLPLLSQNQVPPVIKRVGAMAWLTGPIDIPMGAAGRTVPYPTGTDSILVGTVTEDYVFSDRFGGVIKVADFEGLTASTAMAKLAQIPHQIMTSGPDQAMTTSPETYHPKPTVFVQSRVPTGDPTFDLTEFAMTATDEPWIVQYGSVSVENPKFLNDAGDQKYPPVSNDRLFFFNGVLYAVASLRYAGVTNLPLENPFVFTRSMMKLIANLAAYEFLIPRNSAHIKILDPFSVYNTTPLKVLDIVTYLVRGIDHYAGPKYATGRVLSVNYSLRDDIIDLEIA